MRFHPYGDAPSSPTDTTVGGSRIAIAIGAVICLGFAVGGVYAAVSCGAGVGWVFAAIGTLFSVHVYRTCWWAFSGHDWTLRYNPRRMLIKIGPTVTWKLDEVPVLELEVREVAWIRAYRNTTVTAESDGTRVCHYAYLEIMPKEVDLAELRERITRVSVKKGRFKWWFISGESTTTTPIPVSVSSDGQIRLAFSSPYDWLRPSLEKTVRDMGRMLEVRPAVVEHNDYTVPAADKQKMEKQILESAETGRVMDAVKLARKRYGYSLAEAKRFVEELRGGKGRNP